MPTAMHATARGLYSKAKQREHASSLLNTMVSLCQHEILCPMLILTGQGYIVMQQTSDKLEHSETHEEDHLSLQAVHNC